MSGAPDPLYVRERLTDDERSAATTTEAIEQLDPLFGLRDPTGIRMAIQAAGIGTDADIIAASMTALVSDLLSEL